MVTERYVTWARTAPVEARCNAVRAIAQVLSNPEVAHEVREEAGRILVRVTADPSLVVRSVLAEVVSADADLPRTILWQVCRDVPAVSAIAYAQAALAPCELIEALDGREPSIQTAIAGRPDLTVAVVRAVVETANAKAVLALLDNDTVVPGPGLLLAIAKRFANAASIRDRLLERDDCPPVARTLLADALAADLATYGCAFEGVDARRLQRAAEDAASEVRVRVAQCTERSEREAYLRSLKERNRITPAFLLRCAAANALDLLAGGLALSADLSAARATGLVRRPRGRSLEKAAQAAGMSPLIGTVLAAGLRLRALGEGEAAVLRAMLDVAMDRDADPAIVSLLARLEGEATRREAFAPLPEAA